MYSSYANSPTNMKNSHQQINFNLNQRNKESPYYNQIQKHFSQTIPIP